MCKCFICFVYEVRPHALILNFKKHRTVVGKIEGKFGTNFAKVADDSKKYLTITGYLRSTVGAREKHGLFICLYNFYNYIAKMLSHYVVTK